MSSDNQSSSKEGSVKFGEGGRANRSRYTLAPRFARSEHSIFVCNVLKRKTAGARAHVVVRCELFPGMLCLSDPVNIGHTMGEIQILQHRIHVDEGESRVRFEPLSSGKVVEFRMKSGRFAAWISALHQSVELSRFILQKNAIDCAHMEMDTVTRVSTDVSSFSGESSSMEMECESAAECDLRVVEPSVFVINGKTHGYGFPQSKHISMLETTSVCNADIDDTKTVSEDSQWKATAVSSGTIGTAIFSSEEGIHQLSEGGELPRQLPDSSKLLERFLENDTEDDEDAIEDYEDATRSIGVSLTGESRSLKSTLGFGGLSKAKSAAVLKRKGGSEAEAGTTGHSYDEAFSSGERIDAHDTVVEATPELMPLPIDKVVKVKAYKKRCEVGGRDLATDSSKRKIATEGESTLKATASRLTAAQKPTDDGTAKKPSETSRSKQDSDSESKHSRDEATASAEMANALLSLAKESEECMRVFTSVRPINSEECMRIVNGSWQLYKSYFGNGRDFFSVVYNHDFNVEEHDIVDSAFNNTIDSMRQRLDLRKAFLAFAKVIGHTPD